MSRFLRSFKTTGMLQGFLFYFVLGFLALFLFLKVPDLPYVPFLGTSQKSWDLLTIISMSPGLGNTLAFCSLIISIILLYAVVPSADTIRLDSVYTGIYNAFLSKLLYGFITGFLYSIPFFIRLLVSAYPLDFSVYFTLMLGIEVMGDIVWMIIGYVMFRGKIYYFIAGLIMVKLFSIQSNFIGASLSLTSAFLFYFLNGSMIPLILSSIINLIIPLVIIRMKGELW